METETNTIALPKEHLKKMEEWLQEYLENKGIYSINTHNEDILNYDRDELAVMDEEDLALLGVELARYAAYIHQEFNKNNARAQYADSMMGALIASHLREYPDDRFLKGEILKGKVCAANSYAKEIQQLERYSHFVLNSLKDFADKISFMSRQITELQKIKHWRQRG